jgi:hypothetical protein
MPVTKMNCRGKSDYLNEIRLKDTNSLKKNIYIFIMEMSNEANILAEKFHSYADLQLKFEAWSAKYFQPMNIRDSQYLENKKEKNGCK